MYVTTADHAYTLGGWGARLAALGVLLGQASWEQLLRAERVPAATYVFTDFDRLSVSELQAAATVRKQLVARGLSVINDPCHFTPRASLIRRLKREGIIHFDCHLPVAGEWPERFPVFLRTLAGHRGTLSDLLHDAASCRTAWYQALDKGYVAADLAFVEFAAQPTATGTYQKHAAFRLGDRIVRANTVNERKWMAKHGELGLASAAQYRQELEEVHHFPLAQRVMQVFEIAGIEYGRVDYGITDQGPQFYEINTNPYLTLPTDARPHPNADRQSALQQVRQQLTEAFDALARAHEEGEVVLEGPRRVVRV